MRTIMTILTIILLSACAATGEQSNRSQEIAAYDRNAGAAESWVRYTSIRNWWPVGYNSIVFEMDRSRHYLVRLAGACDFSLGSASMLRLENTRRNVLSEFDRVVVGGQACQVQSIREVDLDAVEAELEADGSTVPGAEDRGTVEG